MLEECLTAGKGSVEYIDIEALFPKMRAKIQDPERSIGLQYLKFLRILVEKIAVGEEKFRHLDLPRCWSQILERNKCLIVVVFSRSIKEDGGGFRDSGYRFEVIHPLPARS
jgi:hypothetical protein